MRFFDRFKTGLVLTKDSLFLMRHNPKLGLFPLVSGISGLLFLTLFLGITFGIATFSPDIVTAAALFIVYLGLTFISTFFTAGLVHQTRQILEGNEPSLKKGLKGAWQVKKPLLVWAFISATISIVINIVENSDSRAARFFGVIFGVAWTLMTFFVVPTIVFEKPSTRQMFKKSANTFKQTWGETPISLIGVQISSILTLMVFAIPAALLFYTGLVLPAVALILVGVLASFLVGQTLQGVVKTTLYIYASTGKSPEEFDNIDFDQLAKKEGSSLQNPLGTSFH